MPQHGTVVNWLFTHLNTMLVGKLSSSITSITQMITPFVTIGLTISFIWWGMAIMRGTVEEPLLDLISKVLRISVITSIALAGGLYQTEIAQILVDLPDDLVHTLFDTNIASLPVQADVVLNKTTTVADEITSTKGAWYDILPGKQEIVMAMAAASFAVGAALFTVVVTAVLLLVKIAMVLLAAVGPIFILALLFEPTKDLFARWLSQVFNYLVMTILTALLCKVLLDMQSSMLDSVTKWANGGQTPIFQVVGAFLFFTVLSIVILISLPSLSNSLAGGFSINYGAASRAGTGGVKGAAKIATRFIPRF